MDAWQNGCFKKMDDHLAHTTPDQHPPKMDVLPKHFLHIILAAKLLVRHSSTSFKQQRRPLPSLLFVTSSMIRCGSGSGSGFVDLDLSDPEPDPYGEIQIRIRIQDKYAMTKN